MRATPFEAPAEAGGRDQETGHESGARSPERANFVASTHLRDTPHQEPAFHPETVHDRPVRGGGGAAQAARDPFRKNRSSRESQNVTELLQVEYDPENRQEGVCLTLLVAFRAPLEEVPIIGKCVWHETSKELGEKLLAKVSSRNLTIPIHVIR
ncbi:hypothetical protein BDFB_014512 [Asbolus verrucosus]|uniref:Uncharacterized protein n=1 Tax=Asbolus verrucosus TaxID=1661398 RepID=A0A482VU69_ASBVE|nr:hypothetical protein BDFB_014512 [Asbolus verrucosus]